MLTTWQTRLAHGRTTGKGGGKEITVTLRSVSWNSQHSDKGAYLTIVVGGNPLAELLVEPNLELSMTISTVGVVVKGEPDASQY